MISYQIYLKKYKKATEDLVFLSPCIAKRLEINDKNTELIMLEETLEKFLEKFEKNQK